MSPSPALLPSMLLKELLRLRFRKRQGNAIAVYQHRERAVRTELVRLEKVCFRLDCHDGALISTNAESATRYASLELSETRFEQ